MWNVSFSRFCSRKMACLVAWTKRSDALKVTTMSHDSWVLELNIKTTFITINVFNLHLLRLLTRLSRGPELWTRDTNTMIRTPLHVDRRLI